MSLRTVEIRGGPYDGATATVNLTPFLSGLVHPHPSGGGFLAWDELQASFDVLTADLAALRALLGSLAGRPPPGPILGADGRPA